MKAYLNILMESEKIKLYLRHFEENLKKNPTYRKYENLSKTEILILYDLVNNRTSNLSKKERDLVIYFAEKHLKKI